MGFGLGLGLGLCVFGFGRVWVWACLGWGLVTKLAANVAGNALRAGGAIIKVLNDLGARNVFAESCSQ